MDKVEGPQEFTDYLENNIYAPTGEVLLSYTDPTTISMKEYDKAGEVYEQSLTILLLSLGLLIQLIQMMTPQIAYLDSG
jgi:hypothetical protein